jgi:L-ascorbate metabolism protein UlaG (beta-lactamase superfamily)
MIEPARRDDAFIEDVEACRGQPGLRIWWLGQSGFLVQYEEGHLLVDPYLSDSLTAKYAGTATPHDRMTRRVIQPERLSFVDVVTVSHHHTDHLDGDTLPLVLAGGATLLVPAGCESLARVRAGRPPDLALATGESATVGVFDLRAVPAVHEGAPEANGYIVHAGPFSIYHAGDTVRDERLDEAVGQFDIDVALLPINGRLGNMSGPDAARFAATIGARLVVPCHFEMFRFNSASPEAFASECAALNQPYTALRAGERLTVGSGAGNAPPQNRGRASS